VRLVTTVGLVLAILLFAATASARDPKDPRQLHTAAATQLARSIALKRSDLPTGWKAAPKDAPGPPCSAEPDESSLVQTARIDPTFIWTDGATTVGSEIDVFRTAVEARRDWQLTVTLGLMRSCLLESARKQLAKQHWKVSVGSAVALPPPKLGERSTHYLLTFFVRRQQAGKAEVFPFVTEMIAMGVGRTSVVLHVQSPGQQLPSAGLLSLAKKLAKRLASASGAI
jgi:hypothetical protein